MPGVLPNISNESALCSRHTWSLLFDPSGPGPCTPYKLYKGHLPCAPTDEDVDPQVGCHGGLEVLLSLELGRSGPPQDPLKNLESEATRAWHVPRCCLLPRHRRCVLSPAPGKKKLSSTISEI